VSLLLFIATLPDVALFAAIVFKAGRTLEASVSVLFLRVCVSLRPTTALVDAIPWTLTVSPVVGLVVWPAAIE
jgi:hypothetical protein